MTSSNERVILKLGGVEVDITEMPPITLGDKRRVKADGIQWKTLAENDPDAEAYFVLMMLRKVRPTTTAEEVDALPAKVSQDVVRHIIERSSEVDSPLSRSSTPSAGTTGGAEQT